MTALAELLLRHGLEVSGSDTEEVFYTDTILERLGITVKTPFAGENVDTTADVYIYSTAYTRDNNMELARVEKSGKPVLSYPEALGLLTKEKMTLAVCGTHGKTTTSALLATCLHHAGLKPSAIVGSEIKNWGGGALAGEGLHLVLEADEYQNKLQYYQPWGAILTSVDWDHPDYFPTVASYEQVFRDFLARVPRHGFVVVCYDHARAELLSRAMPQRITYGFLDGADVRAVDHRMLSEGERGDGALQEFFVQWQGERTGPYRIKLAGRHNVLNALAVVATAFHLHIDPQVMAEGLLSFAGTKRRFELIGECHGALVFDDYAHHPDEIRATVQAFRELYPKRSLTVIFHPHTFTRTKALFTEFAEALSLADAVHLLDIYGSARETQGGVSSAELVARINQVYPGKAEYASDRTELVERLRRQATAADLVVTMGAGDVWQIAEALVKTK